MTQVLHILRKDLRRLWPHIAVLMLVIAYHSLAAITSGNPSSTLTLILCAFVWLLIGRLIHEESLVGDNHFWLTRPYDRTSLLLAKAMLVALAIVIPFFIADCIIVSAHSLSVTDNLGGLLLRQLVNAAWLILPPFAIAAITRKLSDDIVVWLAALTVALAFWFTRNSDMVRETYTHFAIVIAVAVMLFAVWRQYSLRTTWTSRALLIAAVLLPALPLPYSPLFAIERAATSQAPDTSGITISATVDTVGSFPRELTWNNLHCIPLKLSLGGMKPDWRISILSTNSTVESGDQQWSSGWQPAFGGACISTAGLAQLAGKRFAAHADLSIAIYANEPAVTVPVKAGPFDIPGIGRCQYAGDRYMKLFQLDCKAVSWFPQRGQLEMIGIDENSISGVTNFHYQWSPLNLFPGPNPIYLWAPMRLSTSPEEAVAQNVKIRFTPEKQIALIRREITIPQVIFPPDH